MSVACSTESAPARTAAARAVGTIGMDRDPLAGLVRHVHRRLHLLVRVGLEARHVLVAAGRPVDLDHSRRRRRSAGAPRAHFVDSVGLAGIGRRGAGRSGVLVTCSPSPATNMRGPVIAPRPIRSRMARSIPSEEPRSRTVVTPVSRVLRAFSCARKTVTAGPSVPSCDHGPRSRGAVPVERHVRVRVDQSRDARERPQVDHRRAARDRRVSRPDARDALALDDDDGVAAPRPRARRRAGRSGSP